MAGCQPLETSDRVTTHCWRGICLVTYNELAAGCGVAHEREEVPPVPLPITCSVTASQNPSCTKNAGARRVMDSVQREMDGRRR